MANLPALGHFPGALEVRPLPSTGISGFVGTMGLSDFPDGPAWPSRVAGWEACLPPSGISRVAVALLCRHAVAITPVGSWVRVVRSPKAPRQRPSPSPCRVGSHIMLFEACSAFTRVTACLLAGLPVQPFPPEASAVSLPPPPLRLLPAGAKVAGWDSHPLKSATFSRRTRGHAEYHMTNRIRMIFCMSPFPAAFSRRLSPFSFLLFRF
jgi:hypothetical protein